MDLNEIFLMEAPLSDTQEKVLKEQMQRFDELGKKAPKNTTPLTAEGKLLLKSGTIIHGTRTFNPETIMKIKNSGILTGQAVGIYEDGETYFCADFHRLDKDITLEEYNKNWPHNDGRMPLGRNMRNKSLAFVIEPNTDNEELLKYDCYRDGTRESDLTKSFVNQKGLPIANKNIASSILYGVPSNQFVGIIVGNYLFANREIFINLIKLFPNCYIASPTGEFIYQPGDSLELVDLKREKINLSYKLYNQEYEYNSLQNSYDSLNQNHQKLIEAVMEYSDVETAKQIMSTIWSNISTEYIEQSKSK